jgi:K+-transporting ATPase ATPase A chain
VATGAILVSFADTGAALLVLGTVALLAPPLGAYLARILEGEPTWLSRRLAPLERGVLRLTGIDPSRESSWRGYAAGLLVFNALSMLVLYALLRLQDFLPLAAPSLPPIESHLALNVAISFATNTNWQAYGGETTLSHFVQLLGLTVQNFASAATGIAVAAALFRGLARRSAATIGNFHADVTRIVIHVLLPLSVVFALALVACGVPQTLERTVDVAPLDAGAPDRAAAESIAVGPVASQVAIKQLGTNGGGFFNANSAHPFENPTPLSCFLEIVAILLLPAALCFTFGRMVGDPRQGRAIFAAMSAILLLALVPTLLSEASPNPVLRELGVDGSGGNLEGKEVRFGASLTALFAVATTAASNGSVCGMHDSFMPLGGAFPLWLIQIGEVAFGGVGSGIYGMLMYVILAVFVAGLMVGRAPEYLGKKIEAFEMKMAVIALLLPSVAILAGTALAVALPAGLAGIQDELPHGFTEVLYAFSSAAGNNGSAFGGLAAASPFYDHALSIAMLLGRYAVLLPALAVAGSLAGKRGIAPSSGTLPTHGPLFTSFLVSIVLIVGALAFLPALALGPIAEHLEMLR